MGARFSSWWQQIKQHRVIILIVLIILVVVIGLIIIGYQFDWTGFNGNNKTGKTLWDWMQLLFIPVVLAVAGFWFNHRERKAAELRAENERMAAELRAEAEREIEQQRTKAEREISKDNQREAAMQEYIDKMSDLILHEKLRDSAEDDVVRNIARVQSLIILSRLDARRKGIVLLFLQESGLIHKDKHIINLMYANLMRVSLMNINLYGAFLCNTHLGKANLSEANLSEANLHAAVLYEANLSSANLSNADLSGAGLSNANLSGANLSGAIVTTEQLDQAKSLEGATMPDGSIHQ